MCPECGKKTNHGVQCDSCYAAGLRELLNSPAWLEVRGVTKGDLPGETLKDTMQRELKSLEAVNGLQ